MKRWLTISVMSALVALSALAGAFAQGVTQAFTYQGYLRQGGAPLNNPSQSMRFRIFATATDTTVLWDSGTLTVNVSNGLFTVQLNPPASIWTGADRYLEIGIVSGSSTTWLTPRVLIRATPYANTATQLNMFQSGTSNADRMVITHSPAFPNWGLQYQDSTDKFNFLAGGASVMTVDLGVGRVGIGTSTPAHALDVSGDVRWSGVLQGGSVPWARITGAPSFLSGSGTANRVALFTAANTLGDSVIFQSGSNIGIGTTTPTYPLEVSGGMLVNSSTGTLRIGFPSSANQWYFGTIGGGANLQLWENAASAVRMYFQAGGNVGIGTTSPAARLDIAGGAWNTETSEGDLRIGNATYRLKMGVATGGGGAGHATIAAQGGANLLSLGAGTTLATQRTLTITGSGNVGVGTINPTYLVDVQGNRNTQLVNISNANTGTTANGIWVTVVGSSAYGIYSTAAGTTGTGVYGFATATTGAPWGVWGRTAGSTSDSYGVVAQEPAGGAGHAFFTTGSVAAAIKSFQIDHPLSPETHYLNHFCAEGPEPYTLYRGMVVLDARGEAWVQLPDYFEAINRDATYHLTPVGAPMPNLHVAVEIQNNRFKIAGGVPGRKVSWEVKAIRNDRWVQQYGYQTEQEKEDEIKGKYLHPELYGQPTERGILYRPEPDSTPSGTSKP
ncbi:MAG: hypothetical protein K6U12_11420 [Armatimonadetes bacterium]|nr:hypothetical protein [Armatimonadota bacterium]CUU38222.1 hypothetical protein DCOP10_123227 [Armatimonadetes bacterium DC]